MIALICCGFARTGLVRRRLNLRHTAALGAAQINCIECGGDGVFCGHPEIAFEPCVACKGTGKVYCGA